MARKSSIDKAAETGDWSKLERTARKALRKSGAVLGHSQADPEAEIEIDPAEAESEDPSIEEVIDPGNDAEDELDEPEPEPQDLGDNEDEESEDDAKAKPARRGKRKSIVHYRYSLAGRDMACIAREAEEAAEAAKEAERRRLDEFQRVAERTERSAN